MTRQERIKELQKDVGSYPDGIIGRDTITKFAKKYNKSIIQAVHWFAQVHHESGGFTIGRENINYKTVKRIMEIFGARHSAKVTVNEAYGLVRNPYMLAERVYGLGNPRKARELGNVKEGDGYKYRGGGGLQITGGGDYMNYGGMELYNCPDQIETSVYYFTTAIKEFDAKNIWRYGMQLRRSDILITSRVINIGNAKTKATPNGLQDRINKTVYYAGIMGLKVDLTK